MIQSNNPTSLVEPPASCAECGRPLGPIPASARNKRFCSARCRSTFHTKELRAFREGLRAAKEPQS